MKILFIFICIFQITIYNLLAESQNIPSLYVGKIELGPGINKDKEIKIRNLIILNLIKKYKNSYRVIDDETVKDLLLKLKIKQQIGCDTDICYQMLDDALNTDFKITASLVQESDFKFQLNLKLLKIKNLNIYLENSVDRSFTISQLDYYVKELSSSLVDSKYVINEKNMEFEEIEKIEFTKIKNNINLNKIDFDKTSDSDVMALIKPFLLEADNLYQEKKYTEAITKYRIIIKNINKINKSILIDSLNKRVSQSYDNIYQAKIKDIDIVYSNNKNFKNLDDILKSYKNIKKDYIDLETDKNKEIFETINERIDKIIVQMASYEEKIADIDFENYKFTISLKKYQTIINNLKTEDETVIIKEYKDKINKKIKLTKTTGEVFIKNKFYVYLDIAKKKNLTLGQNKDNKKEKEAKEAENMIRFSLQNCRNFLLNSEMVDEEMLRDFNNLLIKLNKDNMEYNISFGDILTSDDLKFNLKENKLDIIHFPGQPQINLNLKNSDKIEFKNNFIYYGAMSSLLLVGMGAFNYLDEYRSFKNETATISPLVFYYQPYLFNDLLPVMAINSINEQKRIDNHFNNLNNSTNLMESGMGAFGFFYLLSVVDFHLFNNKFTNASTLNLEKGKINFDIKNDAIGKNQSNELQYQIKYSYEF